MKTIAVIFGGQSTEHDVSIVTAIASVIKPLELTKKYRVEPVYIARDGSWYWDQKLKDMVLYQTGGIEDYMARSPKTQLLFDNGLTLVKPAKIAGRKQQVKIDVVFPAMHGTHGEDGHLMGLLEMAGVAYVGCDVAASSIAMDKVLAKQVTGAMGIASTPWVWIKSQEPITDYDSVMSKVETLEYPLFVKPAHLGSSIGITRVTEKSQLQNALEVAAYYDDKVIIEQGVSNLIEVTLPVMGNDRLTPAQLEQPLLQSEDFFDFETKYMQGGKKGTKGSSKHGAQGYSKIPADIELELYEEAVKIGLQAYQAVGCSGIARVDMLIDTKRKKVLFNEINPLPGGLYAHNWRLAGVSSVDLVTKLVDLAVEKWQSGKKRSVSFDTNYLRQF